VTDLLELTRPDDWHLHLRDGAALAATVPATARVFRRAIVMPNLVPPVTTVADALAYRARILEHAPAGSGFEPLMTLYLTDDTTPDEIRRAAASEHVHAVKLYPAGATTNSDSGVTDFAGLAPVLEALEETGLPLLVHGEVTRSEVDVFDRERVFLEERLAPTVERFPGLRVVFEHITTAEAAAFVEGAREGVAATITPQHLLMNRGDLFAGGLQPHNYCLPVLKRRHHQEALLRAATSGSPRFFLGSDSAPHARSRKESPCGCAGCYSAPYALQLYALAFDGAGALDRLEGFASHHGADWYGLPRNTERVRLRRAEAPVPASLDYLAEEPIVPYWAGRSAGWELA
jgi:dihydroorotase